MKNYQIIVISVLATISMSSCSVFQKTATNRTARTIEIATDIQQMPTVADLIVDTVLVREDTTWTNVTFKNTMPKNEMRKVLLGEMLENTQADVIVQPREKVVTDLYHPFKQTYTMVVWGYPARYRNFRTATEEDIRILNGIDPQPVNYNTIYINGGGNYSRTPVHGDNTRQIKPAKEKKPQKPGYPRGKKISNIEAGWNYLFLSGNGFVINTTHVWQSNNLNIYNGFGVGLNSGFYTEHKSYSGSDPYAIVKESHRSWLVPIYYTPRFYLCRTRVAPFIDLRAGVFLGGDAITFLYKNGSKEPSIGFAGGFYCAAFIGVEFGQHFNMSIGSDQFLGGGKGDQNNFNGGGYYNGSFAFKLAYNF